MFTKKWKGAMLALCTLALSASAATGGLLLGGFEAETYFAILLLVLNVTFLFYDYALTVMITAYLRIWRRKLRIDRFFTDRY